VYKVTFYSRPTSIFAVTAFRRVPRTTAPLPVANRR